MGKRLSRFGIALLWLVLALAAVLLWHAPVRPLATIADTRSHIPWSFSGDSRWLLAGTQDQDSLFELSTGRRVILDSQNRNLRPDARPCGFSPDSRYFVGQKKGEVCLWALESEANEQQLGRTASGSEPTLGFSLDSCQIAIVQAYRPLEIRNVNAPLTPVSVPMDALFGRPKASWIVSWQWGAGQTILAEEYRGNRVSCWDLRKTRIRFQINEPVESYGVSRPTWRVSPDGKCCVAIVADGPTPRGAAAKNPMVQAWDIPTGKLLWQRPMPHRQGMFDLSFLPDSRRVVVCSQDYDHAHAVVLQLWNVEDGTSSTLARTDGQEAFLATATGRFFFHALGWWELDGDQARPALTFHDDGYWHDRAGVKHTPYKPDEQTAMPPRGCTGVRRAYMYRVGSDNTVAVRGVMAGVSADDRWLAARLTFDYQPGKWVDWYPKWLPKLGELGRAGRDYELHLFDTDTGRRAPVLHDAEHWLFAPDGKTVVTGGEGDLRIWNLPLTAPVWQRWMFGCGIVVLLGVHWRSWRRRSRAGMAAGTIVGAI